MKKPIARRYGEHFPLQEGKVERMSLWTKAGIALVTLLALLAVFCLGVIFQASMCGKHF